MKDAQRTAADAALRLCLESSIIAAFRLSSARCRHADKRCGGIGALARLTMEPGKPWEVGLSLRCRRTLG